jgi:uncharacterized membrane protein YhiD involved in acid resistance
MFELFPDGPVPEYNQLINVIYSYVWAFLLSSIIAITHRLTFASDPYPKNFFQALILGSIVTTMVMMAIGDSLARGLGVFGAMAIIRFRTRIEDPRDVLFLFAALSTGLAIGVYGYTISFAGTLLFCGVAFLLHFSSFKSFAYPLRLTITLEEGFNAERLTEVLQQHCMGFRQTNTQLTKAKSYRYDYALSLKKTVTSVELMNALRDVTGVVQLQIQSNEPNVSQ